MTYPKIARSIPFFALLVLLLPAISACRESAQPTPTPNPEVVISVDYGETPTVGETVLIVRVQDSAGNDRADVQRIAVRGDMDHAGMVPVLAETDTPDEEGAYVIPFEWTMRGGWILTIEVTLTDGTTTRRDFTLDVTG